MRKELRGWFRRVDFPTRDNQNWLKWITIMNQEGEMVFDTELVPIEQYSI